MATGSRFPPPLSCCVWQGHGSPSTRRVCHLRSWGIQVTVLKLMHKRSSLISTSYWEHSPACLSLVVRFHPKKKGWQNDGLKKNTKKNLLPPWKFQGMPLNFLGGGGKQFSPQTFLSKTRINNHPHHLPFHVSMISQLSAHAVSGKLTEIRLANYKSTTSAGGWAQKPVINWGITLINDGLING